ncbi:MAG: hypothetical protein OEY01_15010 [Desulfobulbaceae bacterium]|nr:hypothetical protein [Desulfobulbaceae bacterium]HIJ79897.1 hypothetical protein [Deltaproteobacteria bacterium]
MSNNKIHKILRLFFLLLPIILNLTFGICYANDVPIIRQQTAKWQEITLTEQILTNITENIMTISGGKYIFNDSTKFTITINNQTIPETVPISPRAITLPGNCDIIFKQYITTNEAHPYNEGTPVLKEVKLKK